MHWLSRVFIHFRRSPVQAVYWRQLYFSGAQAAPLCLIVGACVAMALYGLLHHSYGQSGDFILRTLITVGLAELAPLFVTIILLARSASAIASELATMRVNGEIRFLQRHAISPLEALIIPRVLSAVLSSWMLFLYFGVGMLLAGSLLASPNPLHALYSVVQVMPGDSLLEGLGRICIFAAVITGLACYEGFHAEMHSTAIPQAASRAVLKGLVSVFLLDAVFNLL